MKHCGDDDSFSRKRNTHNGSNTHIIETNTKSFKVLKNSKDFIHMVKYQGLLEEKIKKVSIVNKVKMAPSPSLSFPSLRYIYSPIWNANYI